MSLSIIISAFVTVNRKLLFYLLLFCQMNFKWNDNYFNNFFSRSSLRSFTFSSSLVRLTTTTHDSHIHKILCALSISNGMPNENRNQKLTQTNHHMNSRCLQRIELHNSWPFINKKRMERERERGRGNHIWQLFFRSHRWRFHRNRLTIRLNKIRARILSFRMMNMNMLVSLCHCVRIYFAFMTKFGITFCRWAPRFIQTHTHNLI